jgi:hypothetical protein
MEDALSGSGELAAISPVILTDAQSDTMAAGGAHRPDNIHQEINTNSYATVQDILFDLDRFRVAEPAGHPGVPATETELPEER